MQFVFLAESFFSYGQRRHKDPVKHEQSSLRFLPVFTKKNPWQMRSRVPNTSLMLKKKSVEQLLLG